MFYFHLYLGKIPILTNIFQRGWNHQLELVFLKMAGSKNLVVSKCFPRQSQQFKDGGS